MTNPTGLIADLTKAKALFQQRAICAAMGIEHPASLSRPEPQNVSGNDAQTASMAHAAPVDAQDGGGK